VHQLVNKKILTFRLFNFQVSVFLWRTFYSGEAAYNYFVVHYTTRVLVASELAGLSSRALNSFF
jgi:hypothetical protein